MELISQHAKEIMEKCKETARKRGLSFDDNTLEYIITNQDLLALSPKVMIPTLYDYWVEDVEIIRGKRIYEIYPHNPYETVINTRPAISFYNDNNPDWLNVMIFYHVLGHIDFFQNNVFFKNTWNDDFCGKALADKRLIAKLREEMGEEKRWVDYVIEFARGIDNLNGYYSELNDIEEKISRDFSEKFNFFFGPFCNDLYGKGIMTRDDYLKKIDEYNEFVSKFGQKTGEETFFQKNKRKYPEFEAVFEKSKKNKQPKVRDILEYLMEKSEFINKPKNLWMKQVMQVVRDTAIYFEPQIGTKIIDEGWASYWHQELFLRDERIRGNEVNYAKVNSGVMFIPRVGLNPYAIGSKLLEYIHEMACKGKLSYKFQQLKNINERADFVDEKKSAENGHKALFDVRRNLNDYSLVKFLPKEDFQDFVNKNNLFVAGSRINFERGTREFYVKSRNGEDYREMLLDSLYHPPHVVINEEMAPKKELYLDHKFEGRMLITRFIPAVLTGLEYLWGGPVNLETTEFEIEENERFAAAFFAAMNPDYKPKYKKLRVRYRMSGRKLDRRVIKKIEDGEDE